MAMTPNEQLEILAAYVAGETIQYQSIHAGKWFADSVCGPDYEFDFQHFNYRIQPKPLELWVNVYPEPRSSTSCSCFRTEGEAIRFRGDRARTIHMREVLGD